MRAEHVFKVVDSHAGGAPSRLVLAGLPPLRGATVMEKMQNFRQQHDWIRRSLTLEPRGGNNTSAVVLTEPSHPDADVAVFFMEAHGYLAMCGSDTIATTTALLETGQLPITGDRTVVRLETPAGLIEATAHVRDGHVESVTFVGAPAFCAVSQGTVQVPGFGDVVVDIAYGGNYYAIAEADQFGLELTADRTGPAVDVALELLDAVNKQFAIEHPEIPEVRGVTHAQFFHRSADPQAATRMMVIMNVGTVDRSPCGTGTTAKVATLYAQGALGLQQPFVHQSVTGARFTGRPVQDATVGGGPAVRVAITGSAFVIADTSIYVDRRDVLAEGFHLG